MGFELSRLIMNLLKHTKPIEAEFDALRREIRSNNISFQKKVDQLSKENISTENSLNNTIVTQQAINSALSDQIQTIIATPDDPPPTNYYVPADGAYYLGDGTTEGDWRIIRNGNDLEIQRLESGIWNMIARY